MLRMSLQSLDIPKELEPSAKLKEDFTFWYAKLVEAYQKDETAKKRFSHNLGEVLGVISKVAPFLMTECGVDNVKMISQTILKAMPKPLQTYYRMANLDHTIILGEWKGIDVILHFEDGHIEEWRDYETGWSLARD